MPGRETDILDIRQSIYKGAIGLARHRLVDMDHQRTARRRPMPRHLFGPAKGGVDQHDNPDAHACTALLLMPSSPWTSARGFLVAASLYIFPTICTKVRDCAEPPRHRPCTRHCLHNAGGGSVPRRPWR